MMVVFSHLIAYFLARSTSQYNSDYLKFITDGWLAVWIFFVLSGYALSASQLNSEKRNLAQAAVARYFRLCIPILFTSLIAYFVLKMGLFYNIRAAEAAGSSQSWLGGFYTFDANLYEVIKFSLFDVFFAYDTLKTYNPPLWTMSIELAGSFIIYSYLGIFRSGGRTLWVVALALALLLLLKNAPLACFMFGYLIAELNTRFPANKSVLVEVLSIAAFAAVVMVATYSRPEDVRAVCLMAVVAVLSVAYSSALRGFFSGRLSGFLGKISFSLYLIHMVVICSLSSYLFIDLPRHGFENGASSNIILISTFLACVVCAYLLLPIERLSIFYSKKIAALILDLGRGSRKVESSAVSSMLKDGA